MIRKEVIIGDCRLILGDCLDVLPLLGPVDAVVTDPPYGIGADETMHKQSGTQYGKAAAAKNTYRLTDWDCKPVDQFVMDAVRNAARWSIIFGGNYYSFPPSSCWLVWDKDNGNVGFADCELAWTNLPKAVRRINWMWNGMLRKKGERREGHPTQKPVGVMKWAITQIPEPGRTILDPFMGSGTTGVACVELGRSFIGIELDEGYFNIACERIRRAYGQLDLFIDYRAPRAPQAVQQAFLLEAAE